MQLPQLFRRGIVVALDTDSNAQLAQFRIVEPIMVVWLSIPDDDAFGELWTAGVFSTIDDACGEMIDDYEETVVECESLGCVRRALDSMRRRDQSLNVSRFLDQLIALVDLGQQCKHPLYFIL